MINQDEDTFLKIEDGCFIVVKVDYEEQQFAD